ncbi:MAG: hypothetical protein SFZ23_08765 [Planctomycetota bacterium]|nr:hypothetical protein [Planctomycetota bacterium]
MSKAERHRVLAQLMDQLQPVDALTRSTRLPASVVTRSLDSLQRHGLANQDARGWWQWTDQGKRYCAVRRLWNECEEVADAYQIGAGK